MKFSSKLVRFCLLYTLLVITITARGQQGSLAYTAIDDPLGIDGTEVYGISGNNIVGSYQDSAGTHGFIFNGSTYTTLTDPNGISDTTARAIDGDNVLENYSGGTFIYNIGSGTYTTLDVPGPANGISGDQVVGSYIGSYSVFEGTLAYDYSISSGTYTTGTPIGFVGTGPTHATVNIYEGISGNNIVGYGEVGAGLSYVAIMPGITDPNPLEGIAYGISGDLVVGYGIYFIPNTTLIQNEPFLYNTTSGLTQGFTVSDFYTVAYGIDGDSIVGTYQDSAGMNNGFIMSISAVPEPPTFTITIFWAIGLLLFRLSKKRFLHEFYAHQ